MESSSACVRTRVIRRERQKRNRWQSKPNETEERSVAGQGPHEAIDISLDDTWNTYFQGDAQLDLTTLAATPAYLGPGHDGNASWANVVDYVGLVADRRHYQQQLPVEDSGYDHAESTLDSTSPQLGPSHEPNTENIGVAAIFEAKDYFQVELRSGTLLTTEQRHVLQSALDSCICSATVDLVAGLSQTLDHAPKNLRDSSMYPSEEAMCLLMAGTC